VTEKASQRKCIVAVRIRGTVSAKIEARETLKMLHLTRNNYAVLIDNRPPFIGMLKAAQNYISWGEASKETVSLLISKWGRPAGTVKFTDEYLQRIGYESAAELSDAVYDCKAEYWKLPNIQPVFRLHPPSKGFKGSTKKGYGSGGELGYRGEKINELVKRMA
jgi:large subunit ribosomal protein L30